MNGSTMKLRPPGIPVSPGVPEAQPLPPAGIVDQSAAASSRPAYAAASRSIDGDSYTPGLPRCTLDAEGRTWILRPNGSKVLVANAGEQPCECAAEEAGVAIVRTGQGTSETEVREPVAASSVEFVGEIATWAFLILLVVLGVLIGAFGHAAMT